MERLGGPTGTCVPGATLGPRFSVGVGSAFCSLDGATSGSLSNDIGGAYCWRIDSLSALGFKGGDRHDDARSDHHPVSLSL